MSTTQATVIRLKLYHFSFYMEIKGRHFMKTVSIVTAGKLASQTREIPTSDMGHLLVFAFFLLWRAESLLLDSTLNDCGGLWTEPWTCYIISVSFSPQGFLSHFQTCWTLKQQTSPQSAVILWVLTVGKDLCE